MKQYAKCFPYTEGETFPFFRLDGIEGKYLCSGALYEKWHPQAIEDDEFNMIINLDGELVKVRSCHFDFVFDDIQISWCVDDILDRNHTLTHEQCVEVLQELDHNHDCNFGITWDHIDVAIHDLFGLEPEFEDDEEEEE